MGSDQELLARLIDEEETLQFAAFTNETALKIGMRLVELARRENRSITVDIRRSGQQLFHCALSGTSADNDAWIERKNRVVNRFGHSSYYMGRLCAAGGTSLEAKYMVDPREYAAHGGAFPITIANVGVVGTVTVSGLPQEEDHSLVVRVLREFHSAAPPAV